MTEMYGGNTPIVPDETDAEWELEEKLQELQELQEPKMINSKCSECGGELQLGIAIKPEPPGGCFYTPPLITHKNMELISVYKCVDCGYSCDDDDTLIDENPR